MIRFLENMPENVLGVEASGKVTEDDYERVLIPAVRERLETGGKIRIVYVLGEEFESWTGGALWEDAKLGVRGATDWERIAVVTDRDSLRHMVKAFGWMIPGDIRVFDLAELDAAKDWAAN